MANQQNPKIALVISGVVMMMGVSMAVFMMAAPAEPEDVEPFRGAPAEVAAVPANPAPPPQPVNAVTPPPAVAVEAAPPSAPEADELQREVTRHRIWTALMREHDLEPAGPGKATPSESAASLLPTLDRTWLETARGSQLEPAARACQSDPEAKLSVALVVVGFPDTGAIVESAEPAAGTDAKIGACVVSSLEALVLPAPPRGGRSEVTLDL